MATYKYTAKDPVTGKTTKSIVQADSIKSATSVLLSQNLAPINIVLENKDMSGIKGFFSRIKAKDKVIFSRQLATLINSGLPLIQGLNSVSRQTRNSQLRSIASKIISDVEGGSTLGF
jgi:type IV pilus assembly protein PilC